jgi:hypothetical protein
MIVQVLLQFETPMKGALPFLLTSEGSGNLYNREQKLQWIQLVKSGISFDEFLESRTREIFTYLCDQIRLKFYLKTDWVKWRLKEIKGHMNINIRRVAFRRTRW